MIGVFFVEIGKHCENIFYRSCRRVVEGESDELSVCVDMRNIHVGDVPFVRLYGYFFGNGRGRYVLNGKIGFVRFVGKRKMKVAFAVGNGCGGIGGLASRKTKKGRK